MTPKLNAFIQLIRIKTLIWFGVASCLGFGAVIANSLPPTDFLLIVLSIILANIGAIIVNDLGDIECDAKSDEIAKRNRPLVIGIISKQEAIGLAILFYALSIAVAFLYGFSLLLYSCVIIIFSLSYSVKPFKFCAKPLPSVFYWIILCIVSYVLMIASVEHVSVDFVLGMLHGRPEWVLLTHHGALFFNSNGAVFLVSIIFFMAVAEIMAKDLRDFYNDAAGGRDTFVHRFGIHSSSMVCIMFAWIGLMLWAYTFIIAHRLSSPYGYVCIGIGIFWCLRLTMYTSRLMKNFEQRIATRLHIEWTYVYAAMQAFTFSAFSFG